MDIVISNLDAQPWIIKNPGGTGNWLLLKLRGTVSNRDAIGAAVRIYSEDTTQLRMVKSGSSYLSQSELPVTFGVGKRERIERMVIEWPSGRTEEYKNLASGRAYECVEGKGISAQSGF